MYGETPVAPWPVCGQRAHLREANRGIPGYTCHMNENERYRPGETVPASGIYECDCGQEHHWSTDVKGHVFPPLPAGCPGGTWGLWTRAHQE